MDRGTTATAIAAREDIDPRTVRLHVGRARRTQAVRAARDDILRSAVEAHQADLAEVAAGLARNLRQPVAPPVVPSSTEGLPPMALADHLGRSPTGKALRRWLTLSDGLPALRGALADRVAADPAAAVFVAHGGSLGGLQSAAVAVVEGTDLDALPVSVHGSVLGRGPFGVGEVAVEAPDARKLRDALVAEHRQLLKMAQGWPEAAALHAAIAEARALAAKLGDALDVLRLRRFVTGSCRYCPDSEDL